MTSEHDAHAAREQHAEYLRRLGAHAIAVDEVKRKGNEGFGVIAFFEEKPKEIPRTLEVKRGKKKLEVPLVARVQEKFKPE
jgi:hypothetical protein